MAWITGRQTVKHPGPPPTSSKTDELGLFFSIERGGGLYYFPVTIAIHKNCSIPLAFAGFTRAFFFIFLEFFVFVARLCFVLSQKHPRRQRFFMQTSDIFVDNPARCLPRKKKTHTSSHVRLENGVQSKWVEWLVCTATQPKTQSHQPTS